MPGVLLPVSIAHSKVGVLHCNHCYGYTWVFNTVSVC